MYGAGFGPEGSDDCQAGDGTSESFLYRIDMRTYRIDAVAAVGAVPKYVAVTPDQRYVHWFVGTGSNPTDDLALGPLAIHVHLGATAPTAAAGTTDLGTFSVTSIDGISTAAMSLADPAGPGPDGGWTLRPVVRGADHFPGLA